jgi:hypothetical protein
MNARIVAALMLAAATGCIENNVPLRITAACFPPVPTDEGVCAYPAKCESVWMDNLQVDTTYVGVNPSPSDGTLYWPFQADNLRPANGERFGAVNSATAFITGFKISYTSDTVSIPDAVLDDTTRTVDAEGSTVLSIPVIPPAVTTLLSGTAGLLAQVRAEIRATGRYGDGQTFETGPFSVVVDVQNGSWAGGVTCPTGQVPVGYCPQPGQSGVLLCKAP